MLTATATPILALRTVESTVSAIQTTTWAVGLIVPVTLIVDVTQTEDAPEMDVPLTVVLTALVT
jgi:hypothetical protein